MSILRSILLGCLISTFTSGCSTLSSPYEAGLTACSVQESQLVATAKPKQKAIQKIVYKTWISAEVENLEASSKKIKATVKSYHGYIENSSVFKSHIQLILRIPSNKKQETVDLIKKSGKILRMREHAVDVTEEYLDVDARLKNMISLRARLTKLLDKAQNVKEVLAIEKELGRLQGDIDSLDARLKNISNQVNFSTVTLTLEQKKKSKILGPLGLMFKGAGWCLKKLFVIRD